MNTKTATWSLTLAAALILAGCASSTAPSVAPTAVLSPADLVASLADVANGRNADLAETGLALKTIELRLLVGRERRGGAHASFLVLDAGASSRTEVSFAQTFTLELPSPAGRKGATGIHGSGLPGVAEFVDAAIAAARELVDAAERAGLPQKLREVELTAKIVRSHRVEGGVAFTGLGAVSLGGGASRVSDEANTVRLVFARR